MNRVRERYLKDVVPALKKEFGYANVMAIPKVSKIVINMGLGEATSNAKIVDVASDELSRIAGQKATVRRAKKSIAAFKVREGMAVGAMVTLRGCTSSSTAWSASRCRACATSRESRARASTAAATTRSASGTRFSSLRSTT